MYVDNYEFKDWMQKLLDKLEEVGKDVKSLQTNPEVMPGDKLLDNQDLCLLFKVSTRTLQRLRSKKILSFMMISGKAYYRASDVREFIKERFDVGTLRKFEKEHGTDKSERNYPEVVHVATSGFFFFGKPFLFLCRYCPLSLVRLFKPSA